MIFILESHVALGQPWNYVTQAGFELLILSSHSQVLGILACVLSCPSHVKILIGRKLGTK